jgi:hypothetical protein
MIEASEGSVVFQGAPGPAHFKHPCYYGVSFHDL